MQANELVIEAKLKSKANAFRTVSVDDFQYREGQPVDPHVVIQQPNISLYCMDHSNQRAIFVETPPEVSLLQAPFYFVAQYDTAQRLIAVPYDALHQLALENPVDPTKIILVYSTGRCGSTLVSRVFDQVPEVASFSEPDVFTQLVQLRTSGQANDERVTTLLHDCLIIMSANTRQFGKSIWAFKFRSYVVSLSDLLYQAVPQAKLIFLYRKVEPWAISFARAFGITDEVLAETVPTYRYQIPLVNDYVSSHSTPISYPEYVARMWVSSMQAAIDLQRQGVSLFITRYEDIQVDSLQVMEAMCAYCAIPTPDLARLNRTLSEDSQAGTVAARTEQKSARTFTDNELIELENGIRQFGPSITSDMILPGTFKPSTK